MKESIKKQASEFFKAENFDRNSEYYCETRDIFQARLDKMTNFLLKEKVLNEDDVYIISAAAGEIGNNSFDHNIGLWIGEMGIFYAYMLNDNKFIVALSDAGQGILSTLKKVKPEIESDKDALKIAFNERVSGRAPESRGNGLKFVKANIKERGMHLEFVSGNAKVELNDVEKIEEINNFYQGCVAIISN
ncbi:MAG: hypothetical protein U9R06_02275 [Patescibacteria group bacterium]|nr:hypothetical protein [Patescibacteria group bacterium]